jgi:trans-aconitate 2-methyltransferase
MNRIVWDASDYAKNSSTQATWGMELIDKLDLSDFQSLLDIGCGDGKLTACIAQKFNACSITGVDVSSEMIRYAQERFAHLPNLRFISMDASALAFDEPFDMAISNSALHWIRDHQPVLQGLYRCLKPGARIILQMSNVSNEFGLAIPTAQVILSDEYQGFFRNFDFRFSSYTADEYIRLLEHNGFNPIRVEIVRRTMHHSGRAGLTGLIRTTWLPFTGRIPEEKREAFINAIVEAYLKDHPVDEHNRIEGQTSRLEVEAIKPA